jgi:hypothetical protein
MKPSRLLFIIACISSICALFIGVVSALDQDEARVLPIWSTETETFFPGSSVTVRIWFTSAYSGTLTIYRVGLHFDWMDSGEFVGLDISNDPVTVLSNDSYTSPPINILIPQGVSSGNHTYFVGVEGVEGVSNSFSWDSLTRSLQIEGPASNDGANVENQQYPWLIIVVMTAVVGVSALILIFIFFKRKQKAPINRPPEN